MLGLLFQNALTLYDDKYGAKYIECWDSCSLFIILFGLLSECVCVLRLDSMSCAQFEIQKQAITSVRSYHLQAH